MKKLFFFKSSTSSEGNNSSFPPANEGLKNQATNKSKAKKQVSQSQTSDTSPCLRRSRSYSSGIAHEDALQRAQSGSPCSSGSNILHRHSDGRSRRAFTPERQSRAKWFEDAALYNAHGLEIFERRSDVDSPESSSNDSTNASHKVLDRYIDREHQQDRSTRSYAANTNRGDKRPPRVQYIGPASPKDVSKQKPIPHSVRETNKASQLYKSSRDWLENGFGNESPKKLAKHVIKRLSQSRPLPRVSPSDFDSDIPITIEDIYGGSLRKCPSLPSDEVPKEISTFMQRNHSPIDDYRVSEFTEYEEDFDQTDQSTSATDEVRLLKADLESKTRRLEKEKHELQTALEKELDRRSSEWYIKLEKYQAEEHRLRERVRELAEQNVSLQREVSTFSEREIDNISRLTHSERQIKDLNSKMEEVTQENHKLQKNFSELQEKYRAVDEDRECFKRNYKDREKECKDLHRAITRLLRTSSEQEKTIEGLREGLNKEVRMKNTFENPGNYQLEKLQVEQIRLIGVEQALRKEVESCRLEVDSLRHENINLLRRLKGSAKDGGYSTFKLEQEAWDRVHCLQNQGLCMINESTQLCMKLLENIKMRSSQGPETEQGVDAIKNGLDSQFVIESDMKLQGLKRGAENLLRSLQNVSAVLHEKSIAGEEWAPQNNKSSEDKIKSDLKAETLVTSLLREKLYSREMDLEQLQAELAAAVRGNDVLQYEVQNALDTLSCVAHKMKDLELQMIKKDDNIYRLQNDLQDCTKELAMVKGILPKVSQERDMMWEEVKQCSENNMLLNSEVGVLKKKIEALDEDVLLKEGQITILKDALGKPFDYLSSPNSDRNFLLN